MRYRLPVWLVLVAVALAYMISAGLGGLDIRTNMLALLPDEGRSPAVEASKLRVKAIAFKKAVFLIGHERRPTAMKAAEAFSQALRTSGDFQIVTLRPSGEGFATLLAAYKKHGDGLLSPDDRAALAAGQGEGLARRALAGVFSGMLPVQAATLEKDPFLLLHGFVASLPNPAPLLHLDGGMLTTEAQGKTWIYLDAQIVGDPLALSVQRRIYETVSGAEAVLPEGAELLRTGAVFFARAGASTAMTEAGTIGGHSVLGVLVLLLVIFRGVGPLFLNVLAIVIGIVCAAAAVIFVFGNIHVIALLMGTSLIGVSVDYGLHYCCGRFGVDRTPGQRLSRILPGLTLGLATTMIGYACLAVAPLPGLRQVSVFTVVGLAAAFLTVVVLFPRLDRAPQQVAPGWILAIVERLWAVVDRPRFRWATPILIVVIALPGLAMFRIDDDVRRLQRPNGELLHQQGGIEKLTGFGPQGQYLLIDTPDSQASLRLEESISGRLNGLVADGVLTGWQGVSRWVPSVQRQGQNRALIAQHLEQPFLAEHRTRLGLSSRGAPGGAEPLILEDLAVPESIGSFIMAPGQHLLFLNNLRVTKGIDDLAASNKSILFVDPAADVSNVLQRYRQIASMLLGLAVALGYFLLLWRYGWRGGLAVMAAPVIAVVATPLIAAYAGIPMTMFSVLAMILVMSIGGDYAIFCRETDHDHRDVTLIAVLSASLTTLLSFGLLAASSVAVIQEFGLTMIIGTTIAVALAPMARRPARQVGRAE